MRVEELSPQDLLTSMSELSVAELETAVSHHNRLYWVENSPVLPDPVFDQLVETLRSVAPTSPVLDLIGAAELGFGDKIEHEAPMLSLDKAYDEATVIKWSERFEGELVGSPKIDGIACSIRYDATGQLALSATRGDGVRGEVITENVKRIKSIPNRIEGGAVEVRGEVYMPLSVFKSYEKQYANPRNLAAGALKQKDPDASEAYALSFFAYGLEGEEHDTEIARFERLEAMGFTPVPYEFLKREEIQSFYDKIEGARSEIDYELDGVVFRANSTAEQRRLGNTAHHPRHAIAYKFQGESGTSQLVDVQWSVSRTGAINPVAVVEPVFLSGASVTRASLHNLSYIEELGLTMGSEVLMTRRGGVIPHVESVVRPGDAPIELPQSCPSCGASPTERRGDVLFCPDEKGCTQAQLGLLKHFIDAVDIKGFGPKLIDKLFEKKILKEPADFYLLSVGKLLPLERMGRTLANKLVNNVQEKRGLSLPAFLVSLAIQDLGKVAARLVAQHFNTLDAVRQAKAEDFAQIHGLGELTGEHIAEGLHDRSPIIDRLLDVVEVADEAPAPEEVEVEADPDNPIAAKSFVFTGAMVTMKRKEAQAKVQELGGKTPDNVKAELDYLVLGEKDFAKFEEGWRSSKLKKVDKFNEKGGAIKVISEQEFVKWLD